MIGSSYDSRAGDISLPIAQMEAQKVWEAVPGGGRQSWGGEEKFSLGWAKAPSTLWEACHPFPRGAGMRWGNAHSPTAPRPTGISSSAPPQPLVHYWPGGEFCSDPQVYAG